jgi:uncharacterized protein with GYD domain
MPTYLSLLNFKDQGIENIGNAIMDADRLAESAQHYGCNLLQSYWTMGPYDLVLILEAPDDKSATTFLLHAGSLGVFRTTTLRAYDREEMKPIIGRLGY